MIRRKIKPRVWVAIAIMIILIIVLCKACSSIIFSKDKNRVSTEPEKVTTTATTVETKTTETAETAITVETKQEETDNNEVTTKKAEVIETTKGEDSQQEVIEQFGTDDPDASSLIAYLGERPVNMQEIPTFENYVKSQEKAWVIDFKGTNNSSNNDPRRLYFKQPVEKVKMEYESKGVTKHKELNVEKLDDELFRVTPPYSTQKHIYMTFEIVSDGKSYYMTWIPPIE